MKCPYCTINFHEHWETQTFFWNQNAAAGSKGIMRHRITKCPSCNEFTIEVGFFVRDGSFIWHQVFPIGSARGAAFNEVPENMAQDYREACVVLPFSPKACAALARRCVQNILHDHGYHSSNLSKEIDLFLAESDSAKASPRSLRDTIDSIRNFGNFSAHPITDITSLQVIDVEPHEAEWCLEIVEQLFEFFYVGPASARAKKAALNAKLASAGKPDAK